MKDRTYLTKEKMQELDIELHMNDLQCGSRNSFNNSKDHNSWNHDTTRLSEPQTKLAYEKAYALYNMSNVVMLSNPSIVNLLKQKKRGLRL